MCPSSRNRLKGGRVPARQWDPASKAKVVLEGLRGKPETAVCKRHSVKPAEYRRWRKQFLANIAKPFEAIGPASADTNTISFLSSLGKSRDENPEVFRAAHELIEALPNPIFFTASASRPLGA